MLDAMELRLDGDRQAIATETAVQILALALSTFGH